MLLKIKVIYKDDLRVYLPTSNFLIDDFIHLRSFESLLAEVQSYIRINDVSKFVRNKNEVWFDVKCEDGMYVTSGPTKKISFSLEDVVSFVAKLNNVPENYLWEETRKRDNVLLRSFVYSAAIYFQDVPYKVLSRKYGWAHDTIMHATRQTLPKALYSNDPKAVNTIRAIAERYGDDKFIAFCQEFNFYRR